MLDKIRDSEKAQNAQEGEQTMVPFDAKFDVARDNLATYKATLKRVICLLESKTDARPDEISAYRQELERVNNELNTMRPDDQALVNKANHVYARVLRNLREDYLTTRSKA